MRSNDLAFLFSLGFASLSGVAIYKATDSAWLAIATMSAIQAIIFAILSLNRES